MRPVHLPRVIKLDVVVRNKKTGRLYRANPAAIIDATNQHWLHRFFFGPREYKSYILYARDGEGYVREEKEFWEKFELAGPD